MVCGAGAGKISQTTAGADTKFQPAQDSNTYTIQKHIRWSRLLIPLGTKSKTIVLLQLKTISCSACCDRKSPSGMCAKLRTVAASNNREHAPQSIYYCLFAPHISGVFLRAHPVRGESHIQRKANGEVATTSPHFCNEPHRSHVLCEGFTQYDLHILVTAPFCCDRKDRAASGQSFTSHCGSKQQSSPDEITLVVAIRKYSQLFTRFTSIVRGHPPRSLHRDHSIIACSRHIYLGVVFRAHPVRGESHIQRNGEAATTSSLFYNKFLFFVAIGKARAACA